MKWIEAKVVIDYSLYQDMDTAISLVSAIYYDLGLNGVTVESPEYEPDIDWAPDAVDMPEHYAVTGYFSRNERLAEHCRQLESALSRINEIEGIITRLERREEQLQQIGERPARLTEREGRDVPDKQWYLVDEDGSRVPWSEVDRSIGLPGSGRAVATDGGDDR